MLAAVQMLLMDESPTPPPPPPRPRPPRFSSVGGGGSGYWPDREEDDATAREVMRDFLSRHGRRRPPPRRDGTYLRVMQRRPKTSRTRRGREELGGQPELPIDDIPDIPDIVATVSLGSRAQQVAEALPKSRRRRRRRAARNNPNAGMRGVWWMIGSAFGSFVATRIVSRIAMTQVSKRWPSSSWGRHAGALTSVTAFAATWYAAKHVKRLARYRVPITIGSAIATVENVIHLYAPRRMWWIVGDVGPELDAVSGDL